MKAALPTADPASAAKPTMRHPFRLERRPGGRPWRVHVSARGHELLQYPLLNKGTAFTDEERDRFGLHGLIPPAPATLEDQLARVEENFFGKETDLERYLYLIALQDRNETLFYIFLQRHVEEVLPIVYTPTVGRACQEYSHIYRRPRGVYVTIDDVERIDEVLENSGREEVSLLVVTDGERILGTGDQGAGGMGIPIGKLTLYSLGAGIHPALTLPVTLDCGTDSEKLLRDPFYLGRRHPRVRGERYFELLDAFVEAVKRRWPRAIVQWEDLAKRNAFVVLDRYRDRVPSFNDDVLGTGAVALSALRNALKLARVPLESARILFYGAGEACIGTGRAVLAAKAALGTTPEEARAQMAFLDTLGLVVEDREGLAEFKREFARPRALAWEQRSPSTALVDAVRAFQPHALIGATGVPGTFTEDAIRALAEVTQRPILFALSNPSSLAEAQPQDLLTWTQGRAIVATGSPFPPVPGFAKPVPIAQANNMLVFPGVGLGAYVAEARRITDEMFAVASQAVADCVPLARLQQGYILPSVGEIRRVSRAVALAVALESSRAGEGPELTPAEIERRLELEMWQPRYMELVPDGD